MVAALVRKLLIPLALSVCSSSIVVRAMGIVDILCPLPRSQAGKQGAWGLMEQSHNPTCSNKERRLGTRQLCPIVRSANSIGLYESCNTPSRHLESVVDPGSEVAIVKGNATIMV